MYADLPSSDHPLRDPPNLLVLAMIFEGGLGVAAVGLGWVFGQPPLAKIAWSTAAWAEGAAAAVPLVGLLALCLWVPIGPLRSLLKTVEETLIPLFRHSGFLELAVISLLAGVGEEMFFRGVVQDVVAGWVGGTPGIWVGLACATLLFALAHLITPTYAVLAGIMGLYLGSLWIGTQNLLVPIAAHALYDFLALVYLAKIRGPRVSADATEHDERKDA